MPCRWTKVRNKQWFGCLDAYESLVQNWTMSAERCLALMEFLGDDNEQDDARLTQLGGCLLVMFSWLLWNCVCVCDFDCVCVCMCVCVCVCVSQRSASGVALFTLDSYLNEKSG